MYELTEEQYRRLATNFTYHAPTDEQRRRYEIVRPAGAALADVLMRCCPESRELSLALTCIEEAIMWANAAIARNESKIA